MKLNWNKNLFHLIRRRKKTRVIGNDIFATCRLNGRFVIFDGLCISIKGNRHSILTSSMSIKKIISDKDKYFISFPIYLAGALRYKVVGLSYGFNINCSRLVNTRLKS